MTDTRVISSRYGSTCTLCEFVTGLAYVMEASGGLNDVMSDRMDEVVGPVRNARDWLWHVGDLMSHRKPLPSDFDDALDRAEGRALDALPKLKHLIGEACDALVDDRAAAIAADVDIVFAA